MPFGLASSLASFDPAQHGTLDYAPLLPLPSCTIVIVSPHPDDEILGAGDDAVGEVCRDVAKARKVTVWRYPIWTWHHASPKHFAGQPVARFAFDEATRILKALALNCFASQIRPPGREPIVPRHVLGCFTRPFEVFMV
jgi:hypothetical protein